jgi:hypothetical protein
MAVAFGALLLGGAVERSLAAMAKADHGNGAPALAATQVLVAENIHDGQPSSRGTHKMLAAEELKGTIWVGKEPHRRVTVSTDGDIEIKEGKDVYVRFVEKVDDIFVIEVRWWNVTANINVLEFGVLTQIAQNEYRYIEADQLSDGVVPSEFPGIVGRGTFELLEGDKAKLIQIGHLIDGSASGFTAILERADALPDVPVGQTFP